MTICAAIIAKNEAHCIRRCLDSVRHVVDRVAFCDTGSTDGTIEEVEKWAKENRKDVTIQRDSWKGFAHNRNRALELARSTGASHALTIDADDTLAICDPGGTGYTGPSDEMAHGDCINFAVENGGLRYPQPHLLNLKKPFFYRGVTHEFLDCKEPFKLEYKPHWKYQIGTDGARRSSGKKSSDDAYILQCALLENAEPDLAPRYTFYLAQSYRDDGKEKLAVRAYTKRTTMGGYAEEVFYSHYQAGLFCGDLGLALTHFASAMKICPERVEPYWGATRILNRAGMYEMAYSIARRAVSFSMPVIGLFVNMDVYQHMMIDEFSIAAQRVGQKAEGLEACDMLLAMDLPEDFLARVRANRECCV